MAQVIDQKVDFLHRTHQLLAEDRAEKQAKREIDLGEIEDYQFESRVATLNDEIFDKLNRDYAQQALARQTLPTVAMSKTPSTMYKVKSDQTYDTVIAVLTKAPENFATVLDTKDVDYDQKQAAQADGWSQTPTSALQLFENGDSGQQKSSTSYLTAEAIHTRLSELNLTTDDLRAATGIHHKTLEKVLKDGTKDSELVHKIYDALRSEAA